MKGPDMVPALTLSPVGHCLEAEPYGVGNRHARGGKAVAPHGVRLCACGGVGWAAAGHAASAVLGQHFTEFEPACSLFLLRDPGRILGGGHLPPTTLFPKIQVIQEDVQQEATPSSTANTAIVFVCSAHATFTKRPAFEVAPLKIPAGRSSEDNLTSRSSGGGGSGSKQNRRGWLRRAVISAVGGVLCGGLHLAYAAGTAADSLLALAK